MKQRGIILAAVFILVLIWILVPKKSGSVEEQEKTAVVESNPKPIRKIPSRPQTETPEPQTEATSDDDDDSEKPALSKEQIEAYLAKTHRDAGSLIAAFQITGDEAYLKEAAHNFPNVPEVQVAVLNHDLFPEDRRKWLDAFKESAPENALSHYFSALDYLKNGDVQSALGDLQNGNGQQKIDLFSLEGLQNLEEAFLSAGQSQLEAKESALRDLRIDSLTKLKQVSFQIMECEKQYLAQGDSAWAEMLANAGIHAARQLTGSGPGTLIIDQLVGFSMEYDALRNLDPNMTLGGLGKTVDERMQERQIERDEIRQLFKVFSNIQPTLSETDRLIYTDRVKLIGEANAMIWVVQRFGTNAP